MKNSFFRNSVAKIVLIMAVVFVIVYFYLSTQNSADSVSPEAIEAFKKNEELWYQYKLEDAKNNLKKILSDAPDYADANRKMAFIEYYYYRNYDIALRHIQKAIVQKPNDALNYIVSGDIHYACGQYENAVKSYENALNLDDKDTNIYYSLYQSYGKLNNSTEAVNVLEKGNSVNPFNGRINSALHLLYVKNEQYCKAYIVWEKGNVPDTGSLGYYEEWNELYKNALDSGTTDLHYRLGSLYAKLLLYDEAKLELEKALKDRPDDFELNKKLDEISLFIKFRDELAECWNSYYQRRILKGSLEELPLKGEVEKIYKQMLVLFPEIKYSPLRFYNWNNYELNNEIQKKFNVIINCWPEEGFLECYFGYTIGRSDETVSHWGKQTDIGVTVVKNAVVNTFWSWYHKIDGLGGWCQTVMGKNKENKAENVIVLDSKFRMAYDLYEAATNLEKRKKALTEAEEMDKYLLERPRLDVFYSSLLNLECSLKAADELIGKAREKFGSEAEVKAYVVNHLVYDVIVPLTYLHEGQHAIDADHYHFEQWELEYRAMMSEPVYGEMQLLDITSMIHPDIGDDSTVYGKAHTKIFTDIVSYIDAHQEDYPVIDTSKNIMMQLSKLSSDDLKEIARAVFEQEYPGECY